MPATEQKRLIEELKLFLDKAIPATYAGGGKAADPESPKFNELVFADGDWKYRDSYCGFVQSWGREVVWYKGEPFWTDQYGGGMKGKLMKDPEFAHLAFEFLKECLLRGRTNNFAPRGPKEHSNGDWRYACKWHGNIKKFKGGERIYFKGKVVFTHDFLGGIVIGSA